MVGSLAGFERRVQAALEAAPSRIPVILGGCGTGRTSQLQRLRARAARGTTQYIDIERCATTPERFLEAVTVASPFQWHGAGHSPATAREAFDALLAFFATARGPGGEPSTFLLDEVLELRTFENFPGLRHVLRELVEALSSSANRFVLTTRYVARAHRLLRDATARYEVMHVPALSAADVLESLAPVFDAYEQMPAVDRDHLGRAAQALTDGRPAYVRAMGEGMKRMGQAASPAGVLASLLTPGGAVSEWCRFRYELRLHRARGYGALKAILDILADEEPLTLTEIAQRLRRTPGSTKDYLSWLEDVDLVTSQRKKYSFTDPILRLWVRLHCRPVPPSDDEVDREVRRYALGRVPQPDPDDSMAYAGVDAAADERKGWGIIEID